MNNEILLKWGGLKGYNFTDEFVKQNKDIVEKLRNFWYKIYKHSSGSIYGGALVQSNKDLQKELITILQKFYDLGVIFQNNWTDEYFNSFDEIKNYILNY